MKKFSNIQTKDNNTGKPKTEFNSLNNKKEQPTEEIKLTPVAKFFSKLFESREMAHIYHLQVKGDEGSHAKHIALQLYYEGDSDDDGGIVSIYDDLIEIYQAQYGILENYEIIDTSDIKSKEPIEYFEELVEWVKQERSCFPDEDNHLHALIDEVVILIYKTIYKLKYTK